MNRHRIIILTGNHVCHNPRAFKEAHALAEAGYDIEWLGAWFSPELAARDRELVAGKPWKFTAIADWTSNGCGAWIRKQRQRTRRWLGLKRLRLLGWQHETQLGYCARQLLTAAREREADLYIAHSEPALWAADRLRRAGQRVGVDMEDWFSEDLLAEARRDRPSHLLQNLEGSLLRTAPHRTCTSAAMSQALAKTYQCRPPLVIYNAFPLADRKRLDGDFKDRRDRAIPSLHWFSQTLGPGRGLEDLFAALPEVTAPIEVHLRGNLSSDARVWLQKSVPENWRKRLFLHPLVTNAELPSRIAEHDIGLSLEPRDPPSRNVTITNKLIQYLHGGLAVLASDTAGQREVAELAPSVVFLYPSGRWRELAGKINALLSAPEKLALARRNALAAAESWFSWETVAPVLVQSVEDALLHEDSLKNRFA